jgi:hypothetical protein
MTHGEVTEQADEQHPEVPIAAIPVSAPEYDIATHRWMTDRVHRRMREMDEVYASLQHESMSSVAATTVQFDDQGEDMIMRPFSLHAGVELSVLAMINGEFDELYSTVDTIAEQHVQQAMERFFQTMNAVTERTGNVVNATGEGWVDSWITSLERTDMTFDENGLPATQTIVHSDMYTQFRGQLATMTPEQQARFAQVMTRKKAQFDASRRRRRLPRDGH